MSARYTGGLVYNAPGGWSGFFDGAGDYLSVASNAANALGSGDFTIQMWFFLTGTTGVGASGEIGLVGCGNTTSSRYTIRCQGSSTRIMSWWLNTPSNNVTGTTPIALNTWYHVALVRSGSGSNNVKMYLNGNFECQGTSTYNSPADNISIGRGYPNLDGEYTNGFISNLQMVVGTALYTSAFTPPVGPLQAVTNTSLLTCRYPTFVDGSTNNFTITVNGNTAVSTVNPFPTSQLPNPALGGAGNGVYTMSQYAALKAANLWPAFDPFYRNVTLNLHGNGTNAAQNNTFLDSSTNNFTITRNGNTTQGTFSPYGSNWSMYQSDASSAYLGFTTSVGTSFQFAGDFTIEGWVYYNSSSGDASLYVISDNTNYLALNISMSAGNYNIYLNSGSPTSSFSHGISVGVWTHVAMVRSGSTVTLYTNGVSKGTITNSSTLGYSAPAINRTGGGVSGIDRYISNIRVVKSAVYTSAFTPSTTPLTAIVNTSLLTCQSNRFVDNSSNAFTATITGSPSVQRFSPFAPLTVYNPATYGGSGYFDGSGDSLQASSNAAFALSGDFSMECWVYFNGATAVGGGVSGELIGMNATAGAIMCVRSGTTFTLSAAATADDLSASFTFVTKTWYHLVACRTGSTGCLYINGTRVASATATRSYSQATFDVISGLNGFLTDTRIVKGSNPYGTGTTLTVPTTPLTAVSGTSILLSATNAGILDNSMLNDLETVGNAQISTSVKKYGTGSMAFDGSGDYLQAPNTVNANFNNGDFTVEFWMYASSQTIAPIVHQTSLSSNQGWIVWNYDGVNGATSTRKLTFMGNGATFQLITSSDAYTDNTWTHIAVVKNGTGSNNIKIYSNGTSIATGTYATALANPSTPLMVGGIINGQSWNTTAYFNGYIDDLRITKGVARYTGNFTPPTSQVQDQ